MKIQCLPVGKQFILNGVIYINLGCDVYEGYVYAITTYGKMCEFHPNQMVEPQTRTRQPYIHDCGIEMPIEDIAPGSFICPNVCYFVSDEQDENYVTVVDVFNFRKIKVRNHMKFQPIKGEWNF